VKALPFLVALVIAILAGVTRRFWLFVGAAVIAVLAGIDFVMLAVEWWGGPPDCSGGVPAGFPCQSDLPPALTPVPAVAVAVGLFALGAVLVWLAVRVRRRTVTTL
jgi:uncharacterized membrane protein